MYTSTDEKVVKTGNKSSWCFTEMHSIQLPRRR